jgi:phospholipid/cholesterol/gamma-HCH transport system substrate-binding protein
MPRTRSLAWSELKVGIVAVTAIALAVMLIVAVGGQGGFTWNQYELRTKFPNVQGLKSGAVVRLAGVEVGKVKDIQFAGADVEVLFRVNEAMQSRITDQSRAAIGSLSLLGEPIIEISPAAAGRPLQDGEYIPSGRTPGQISDVAASATAGLEQATLLMQDIRAGKGTVGKLFTDDELYREVNAFIASAESVVGQVTRGNGTMALLLRDPAAYRQLNASLANLQEITRSIRAGEGSLGRLMKDDKFAQSLSAATGSMEQIAGRLERGEGTAGKLLTDEQLYAAMNSLTARIDKVVAGLEAGQGTAGQLLQDKQLYENMNTAVSEARTLLAEIRKDPKKYLNVRVSIF